MSSYTEVNKWNAHDDYVYFKEHGICVRCRKEPAMHNRTMCVDCLEYERQRPRKTGPDTKMKRRASNAKRYWEKKSKGLCTKCGRKVKDGQSMCVLCRNRNNERLKQKRILAGKTPRVLFGNGEYCHLCGQPVTNGAKMCATCLEKSRKAIAYARTCKKGPNYFERTNGSYY